MRAKLPVVLLLLLSAFMFSGPHSDHQQPASASAAWWIAPADHGAVDAVLPRAHPAHAASALPLLPAVLAATWQPAQSLWAATPTTGHPAISPRPGRPPAPARAPPSTTR
ncbi:hypothetical protein [Nonomuraea sp. NPDC049784]|uniref:hypothetical protein n=1 Tax=Nonomuraea sp. NPDC049784 TaxID=3154361 RepID=UPI0033FCC804